MQARNFRQTLPAAILLTSIGLTAIGCGERGARSPASALPPVPKLVAAGVSVGGVELSGCTLDQARAKVTKEARQRLDAWRISLRDKPSRRVFRYDPSDFGGYFDTATALTEAVQTAQPERIPLTLKLDPHKIQNHLVRIAELLDVPAREPHAHFVANGGFEARPGHDGRALDVEGAAKLVAQSPSEARSTIDLPFVTRTPKASVEDLQGLGDVLITYTTTFHPSQSERTTNLTLAARNIDGTVVAPGGVFSYNDAVGPRTHGTGFKDAIIYVNNQMKKDVGGGICQVSSTLYNCVLLANMGIVERHAHSLPVHYVEPGRDATVAWDGDDFKFRNTTSRPIIVRAIVHGGTLTEMLIGDKTALPHPDAQVAISVTPKRAYSKGYAVTAYRIIKEDGTLVAREPLGTSFYHFPVGPVPR